MLRFEDIRVEDRQVLDRDFFNRRFRLIAEAVGRINDDVASVTTDTDRLVALGLVRVNEVLGPLLQKLQLVSEVGFLVADSSTPVTVSAGLQTTFAISEELRELFSPTPYLMLQRKAAGTVNDYAVLRLVSYNRANGGLAVEVVSIAGSIGAAQHSDWVISVAAGFTSSLLQQMLTVTTSLGSLTAIAADVQAALDEVNAIIATGAVVSVNGKTGTVALAMSDIPGLTSAIAAKADNSHGHTIAQISELQSTLNAITDGGTF